MEKKKIDWKQYDKKYHHVLLKLKPEVYDVIFQKAKDHQRVSDPKLATYFISVGLQKHVPPQKDVPEINREMFLELKRIGTNLNQLTRNVNTDVLQNKDFSLLEIHNQLSTLTLQIEYLYKQIIPYDNKR